MKKITFLIIITTSILSCNSSTKEQPSRNTNLTTVQIDSIAKVKKLNDSIQKSLELEAQKMKELNDTGIWRVGFYVDDFGEPTKSGYITNSSILKGQFSNTATQNSKLNIKFLISDLNDVSIQLYEYAGNNPVKAYSYTSYKILIQDKNGQRLSLKAHNSSDRLNFNEKASLEIHNTLIKGGQIKFIIIEIDTPTTRYGFDIKDANGYKNAFNKLKGTNEK